MRFSLVIPAYNEEKRILPVLEAWCSFFSKKSKYHELIVVCDGTDSTEGIVRKFSLKNKEVVLLSSGKRIGKGGAVLAGFKKSKYPYIGFVDCDKSIKPEEYYELISALDMYSCVIGSRSIKVLVKKPFYREVLSRLFNIYANLLFHLGIKDTQCGAKVFRKRAIEQILPDMKTTGFEFDVELLWRIKREGYEIKEHPISWEHMPDSKFEMKKAPYMALRLLVLRVFNR